MSNLAKTLLSLFVFGYSIAGLAEPTTKTVKVNGMVCAFCAQGIEKKFKSEKAVEKINVSLENHVVKLQLKEGQALSDERIRTLLKEAGYTVEAIN